VFGVILGLFLTSPVFAQVDSIAKIKADSLKARVELQQKKLNTFSDSLSRKATKVTDSVNQIRAKAMALMQVKDTLKLTNRLDSLRGRLESIPDADRSVALILVVAESFISILIRNRSSFTIGMCGDIRHL